MKRLLPVLIIALSVTLSLSASYKIFLVSGDVITADEKPTIRDGMAFFSKGGLNLTLPVSKIDMEKSERAAMSAVPAPAPAQPAEPGQAKKPGAVRNVNDESLEKIAKKNRLANEGELVPPAAPAEGQPEGAKSPEDKKPAVDSRAQLTERLKVLQDERNRADQERESMRTRQKALRDQYEMATQQVDKDALQAQIDIVQEQINAQQSKITGLDSQIRATTDERNSKPIVVDVGGGK